MEFGKEKSAVLVMRSKKRHMTEGIELRNQEKKKQRLSEKETHKYLGILEAETIKQIKIKKKF